MSRKREFTKLLKRDHEWDTPSKVGSILIGFILLYNFSTQIYSDIKFEFGGGAPYKKTISIESSQSVIKTTPQKFTMKTTTGFILSKIPKLYHFPKGL